MVILFVVFLVLLALGQRYLGQMGIRAMDCTLIGSSRLVEPGECFTLTLTITNRSRLPVLYYRGSMAVPDGCGLDPFSVSGWLLPHQRTEIRYSASLPHRGYYAFGGISLAAGDLLGLSEERKYIDCMHRVTVLPESEPAATEEIVGGLLGEISVRRWIHEDPVLSTGYDTYTGREPQKAIAWGRSLSAGQLMVRRYDHTAEPRGNIFLLLDEETEPALWEQAFSLARAACEELERRRVPFAFRSNGDLYSTLGFVDSVEPGLGHNHLDPILEGLGRATYQVRRDAEALVLREASAGAEFGGYLWIVPRETERICRLAAMLTARSGAAVKILSAERRTSP